MFLLGGDNEEDESFLEGEETDEEEVAEENETVAEEVNEDESEVELENAGGETRIVKHGETSKRQVNQPGWMRDYVSGE